MGKLVATNNASSTLLSALDDTDTTLICATGHGGRFPATTGGNYFYCTLTNAVGQFEVVKVTTRLNDNFTVVRGQDNTVAAVWEAGDAFELRVVAAAINEITNITGSVGAANGIAPLNGLSQVPNANLPIGTANGIAGLDGSLKVAVGNLPIGTANGIAGLDAGVKVPVAQLPIGTANGIAPLDADQQVPLANLPVGEANGIAPLDATSKVPVANLPAMNYLPLTGGTVTGAVTVTGILSAGDVLTDDITADLITCTEVKGKVTPDESAGSLTKITYSTSDPSGTPVGTGQWWIKHEA